MHNSQMNFKNVSKQPVQYMPVLESMIMTHIVHVVKLFRSYYGNQVDKASFEFMVVNVLKW